MLIYPVTLEPDDNDTVLATFQDVPEAITFGDDETDALCHSVGALVTIFCGYMDDRKSIPMPSPLKGRPGVVLPAVVSAKVLLWNAMPDAGMRKADLARRLNLSPTVIDRLLSLTHASRIEHLETALAALGKKLIVGLREAA